MVWWAVRAALRREQLGGGVGEVVGAGVDCGVDGVGLLVTDLAECWVSAAG